MLSIIGIETPWEKVSFLYTEILILNEFKLQLLNEKLTWAQSGNLFR